MKVELVDHMGSDLSVVNAARVSFAKLSSEMSDKDEKLISYLAKHGHWSPFAHAFLSFRIKAPIFVARQLVKHQVGLAWNEVSRRYVDDTPEFYIPEVWRGKPVHSKQGSSDEEIDVTDTLSVSGFVATMGEAYRALLDKGVAPEQARMILPQNTYTEWIWSGSLYAFARVCNLRLDPHAQKETRDVAVIIDRIASELYPISWKELVTHAA